MNIGGSTLRVIVSSSLVASVVAGVLILATLITRDAEAQLNGDVNLDGFVNSLDAAIILQYDAGIIHSLSPKPVPTPTRTPTPPLPPPTPGEVLYEADWSDGADGWPESFGWSWLDGMLVNDGSSLSSDIFVPAPFDPQSRNASNYAIEAEIQFVSNTPGYCGFFGLTIRSNYKAGYGPCGQGVAVLVVGGPEIESRSFDAGTSWHKYRLEAEGNVIRLLVDDVQLIELTDNRFLEPGTAGIFSGGAQVSLRNLRIVAL